MAELLKGNPDMLSRLSSDFISPLAHFPDIDKKWEAFTAPFHAALDVSQMDSNDDMILRDFGEHVVDPQLWNVLCRFRKHRNPDTRRTNLSDEWSCLRRHFSASLNWSTGGVHSFGYASAQLKSAQCQIIDEIWSDSDTEDDESMIAEDHAHNLQSTVFPNLAFVPHYWSLYC